MNVSINVWAVIVGGVAHWVIGALWYMVLFAKPWSKLKGIDANAEGDRSNPLLCFAALVIGVVMAAGLAVVLSLVGHPPIGISIAIALIVWVAFTGAPAFANAIFGGSVALWAIDNSYPLVSLVVMSVILAAWR